MDLWLLTPGHTIRTRDGAEAEVLPEPEDGEWIRVRYVDRGRTLVQEHGGPSLTGTRARSCWAWANRSSWAENVRGILHHIPESVESAGEYEAVTKALEHLLAGLKVFGFAGVCPLRMRRIVKARSVTRSNFLGAAPQALADTGYASARRRSGALATSVAADPSTSTASSWLFIRPFRERLEDPTSAIRRSTTITLACRSKPRSQAKL